MPSINSKITTSNTGIGTHEDVFGVGGYVPISTGVTGGNPPTNAQINLQVYKARRKLGMLVYDRSTARYFLCTYVGGGPNDPDAGTWQEAFTGDFPGGENYVEFTDLPRNNDGTLDLASQTSVSQVLATAVRVMPGNGVQVLQAGSGITITANTSAKTITIGISTDLDGGGPNQ